MISLTRRLRLFGIIIFSAILVACASGPGFVSQESVEANAAEQWLDLLERMPESRDRAANQRVQTVATRILTAAGEDPRQWDVRVFENEDVVNAFALPNRAIGVFTGLLDIAETDGQLAAIMGHEVAHVKLRHAESRINREFAPRILIGVAQLPGEVIDVAPVKTVGSIAGAGVAVGTILPFSRSQELDADREGLTYMIDAGYSGEEAVAFWQALSASGANKTIPEFLSTHPNNARRIRELERAVEASQ